jgi:uncharacterized membrane protein YqhA
MGGQYRDDGKSIYVDDSGFIYTTGSFTDKVDFDWVINNFFLTSNGGYDIFLQKMDNNGNFLWAKSMGGANRDIGNSLQIDDLGNVFITGLFEEKVDFDPNGNVFELNAVGLQDIFIQKLDSNGNLIWAINMGGKSYDRGIDLVIDNKENVYTTGTFREIVDFDPGAGSQFISSNGIYDIFIQKISDKYVGIESIQPSKINLYPNPTTGLINIQLPEGSINAQLQILDITGKTVYQREIDQQNIRINLSYLPNGIYHISMVANTGKKFYGKVMVAK